MPNTSLLQIDSRACAYRFQHYLATVREAHWGYANGPTPGMRQLTRPAGRQQTTEGIGEIITNLSQSLNYESKLQCFIESTPRDGGRSGNSDRATVVVSLLHFCMTF